MASREKRDTVPPDSRSRKLKNEPLEPRFAMSCFKALELIPGTGILAARRYITRISNVTKSLRRISWDFQRKRHPENVVFMQVSPRRQFTRSVQHCHPPVRSSRGRCG